MCPGEWAASVEGAWQHGLPLPPSSEQGVGWGGGAPAAGRGGHPPAPETVTVISVTLGWGHRGSG